LLKPLPFYYKCKLHSLFCVRVMKTIYVPSGPAFSAYTCISDFKYPILSHFLCVRLVKPGVSPLQHGSSCNHRGQSIAPTEAKCDFFKSIFFVVAVFLWSNRVVIRMNMHREATRTPHMAPWGWGEGRKKYFFFP